MFDLDDFFTDNIEYLTAESEAALICNDCLGCTNCCRELSAAIRLDSWDIAMLKKGLGRSFDELISDGCISIITEDGAALPIFANKPDKKECVFLNENCRCGIHPYRAGICRMYPLARMWHDDNTFSYYLQKGECPNLTGEKIQIAVWLGYPDTESYEQEITAYHARLKKYRRACRLCTDETERKALHEAFFDSNFRI